VQDENRPSEGGYVSAEPVDAGAALAVYRACCGNAATMNPSDPGIPQRNACDFSSESLKRW
jgi:hypothetical protein